MKESPKMKVFANYGGKSIPKIPKTQAVYPKIVSFKIYDDAGIVYNFPSIVTSKFGQVSNFEQSGYAGIDPYNFATKSFGPTIAEVPVSTIPFNPASDDTSPNLILSIPINQ